MYTHIYIRPIRPSECLHTKIHVPTGQHNTLVQKPAHQPINNKNVHHTSGGLYRTPTCSSLRRRWWPTPTYPRRWWRTTHRTLLPRWQASTSHRSKHCCSPHYGPPWWRHPHTLLQEALILDTCPHALRTRPATPSPDDGVCHQSQPWPPSEERVMALHQGHRIGRLLAALSGSAGHPAASSHRRLSP
jgi:hypothetical protein